MLLGQAKIADSDLVLLLLAGEEDVLRFEVSVQHAPLVKRLKREAHLQEVSQDGHLGQLAICLPAAPQHALEVATLAVLHDDVDLVLAGDERV